MELRGPFAQTRDGPFAIAKLRPVEIDLVLPDRDVIGKLPIHFLDEGLSDAIDFRIACRVAVPDVVVLHRDILRYRRRGGEHDDFDQRLVAHRCESGSAATVPDPGSEHLTNGTTALGRPERRRYSAPRP